MKFVAIHWVMELQNSEAVISTCSFFYVILVNIMLGIFLTFSGPFLTVLHLWLTNT